MKYLGIILLFLSIGCQERQSSEAENNLNLVRVARSEKLWTGIAVSKDNRIFVNYPRWSDQHTISVAEVIDSNKVIPFPDIKWNSWEPSKSPRKHFVCVQSVYMDRDNNLWILDTGLDIRRGIIEGGSKLLKFDYDSKTILKKIYFKPLVLQSASYLNDVRIDIEHNFAYITDSGTGAILVVNLETGASRRVLEHHPSTKSEKITLKIEGKKWLRPDGSEPQIHSDGIALDVNGEYLYFQALTGRRLYRINTSDLRDPSLSESELGQKVEFLGISGASDGIAFGPDGNLYLTSIEFNAIRRFTPERKVEMVIQHPHLKWPDSIAITKHGTVYVTTSQIHLGAERSMPYLILKILKEQ